MRVTEVEVSGSIREPGGEPPGSLPQVAIAGRSNVGKSSLLNALIGRRRLAAVSKRPGRTRAIQFYRVNGRFHLVDLPGYGFAKVPAEVRQRWGPLIESYLGTSEELLGVIVLVDCRHGPTDDDAQMIDYLAKREIPTLFALTKMDKLSRSEREQAIREALEALDVPEDQLVATSAVTGEGMRTLLESIEALLETAPEPAEGRARGGSDAIRPGG